MSPQEQQRQDPFEGTRMSLGEHLDELRKRLIRGLLAVVLFFVVGWFFYEELKDVALRPMQWALTHIQEDQVEKFEARLAADPRLPRSTYFTSDDPAVTTLQPKYTVPDTAVVLGFGEGFGFALKLSLYFGLCLGAPVLLWQLWRFVAAGLYPKERRVVLAFFPVSVLLFVGGVLFGYFLMVPWGFYFLATAFPPEEIAFIPRLSDYFSLMTTLTLILGAVFQLPLLMNALVRVGILEREMFSKYRPHFIVGAFVIGGILTPPDPFTQSMLAVPMVLLYELGILSTRMLRRPERSPAGSEVRA